MKLHHHHHPFHPALYLATLLLSSTTTTTATNNNCERLTPLTYHQSTAPSDVSAILSLIHSKINKDVSHVVGIDVQWSGTEIHKRVGERVVKSSVTRLMEGDTVDSGGDEPKQTTKTQCFEVPFTILDVNECTLPENDPWHHVCPTNSICINTPGSYECVCPLLSGEIGIEFNPEKNDAVDDSFWKELNNQSRSLWELSTTSSSCPEKPSTYTCCPSDGHSEEGTQCRSNFHCPSDPCHSSPCSSEANCERLNPNHIPGYTCVCPEGTWGNGLDCSSSGQERKKHMMLPKVKFDGVTPTEETVKALERGLICGCQRPVVDVCSGFVCHGKHEVCTISPQNTPICTCAPGHVHDPHYGCVDEHPPLLQIRPSPNSKKASLTTLTQGDKYEEFGVDIIDDNAEEYLRSLKIEYSRPLPQGCLLELGQFTVDYTVATPWTTPDHVSATRTVIIENVNECLLPREGMVAKTCPELVAMCDFDSGAVCSDEVGSYTCICPKGTEGDGFLPIARLKPDSVKGGYSGSMVPVNYRGGTGCRDTSKPVIQILGPNPKTLRVAKVSGLEGDFKSKDDGDMNIKIDNLRAERRSYYENEINFMIKASSGAELCATKTKSNVRPIDCVKATDQTYKGVVDLSSRVTVGEPIPKNGVSLQWQVPYNVVDDAGNKAQTVWRDVIVEEVDLHEFERKTRKAILSNREEEVEHAVKKAVAEEKRRSARSNAVGGATGECPKCESCNCANKRGGRNGASLSASDCDSICEKKIAAALASSGGADSTCTNIGSFTALSRHPWILEALNWTDELIGPDALVMLLVGCFIPTMLYILWRIIYAFFFSNGSDVRTYYHSIEDEEKERRMAQNVTYYPSPSTSRAGYSSTPGTATSSSSNGPRRPPTASLSAQRNNVTFSPQEQHRMNGNGNTPRQNGQTQTYTSPFRTEDGTDSIYQTKSPITPKRNTPAPLGRSYNLRSHH